MNFSLLSNSCGTPRPLAHCSGPPNASLMHPGGLCKVSWPYLPRKWVHNNTQSPQDEGPLLQHVRGGRGTTGLLGPKKKAEGLGTAVGQPRQSAPSPWGPGGRAGYRNRSQKGPAVPGTLGTLIHRQGEYSKSSDWAREIKKRGLGAGISDPNWVAFPPESMRAMGGGGSG